MAELRIAVIDDDWFKREHMKEVLDLSDKIAVVHSLDQDTALQWTDEQWGELDFAIVDVYDDESAGEVGTDVFSGIPALERLQHLEIRTLAIAPHRHHPLVEQRIYQSGANYLYRRWELNDPELLEWVLLNPDESRRPQPVHRDVLHRYGAQSARTTEAVHAYQRSKLYGRLTDGATYRAVGVPRRAINGFMGKVRKTGFLPPREADQTKDASWLHIRDYVLRLIGRKDSPPTSHDDQDELWMR